ncbi:NAD-dependent epimerase/dehydratase family protein [Candidatus Wolfebacteria bacterium]|nr:NAD-dependent epimerase/dehydratase family protein [Candidatus Wolfebacteria bacterium]
MSKLALVTGGAGFIGSHLCERLVSDGYTVISLDNYFTGSKDNHVDGVEYREGHTKDIAGHVSETPDILFHLGEYSRVLTSFDDVEKVWDLNVRGTASVLNFCKDKKVRLIYAGSSTKFGEFDDANDGENQSPYAYFKTTNTQLVNNYGKWFGLEYAITYFYNVYGPRERAGAYGTVIEIFRQKMLNKEALQVFGTGEQRRAFTHVKDTVDGLVLVGEKGSGDGHCISAKKEYSILKIAKAFGGDIEMKDALPGDRNRSKCNFEKMKALGWKASRDVLEYIKNSHG